MPGGRGRSSRPPRGRRGDSRPNNATTEEVGELNANLTERFGKGSAYKRRDQSQQQNQPLFKANQHVSRYFKQRAIGQGAPAWTLRPEVPTADELLPYGKQPLQQFIPADTLDNGWADIAIPGGDEWGTADAKSVAQPERQVNAALQTATTSEAPVANDAQKEEYDWQAQDGEDAWAQSKSPDPQPKVETQDQSCDNWNDADNKAGDAWGAAVNNENGWNQDSGDAWGTGDEQGQQSEWGGPQQNEGTDKADNWGFDNSESQPREFKLNAEGDESFENVRNKVDGPWSSKQEYLRSHYLLLREDALRPLREAVEHVRSMYDLDEDPSKSSIGIYDQVHVSGITFARKGIGIRVKFSLGRVGKNIHWEQSTRLRTGTLVALMSPDKSRCKIATIAARPLDVIQRNPPEIDLFFHRPHDIDIDCTQDWIMVEERRSFFEAQRHTLVALQRMMEEDFPLAEHLIDLKTDIEPPEYVKQNPNRDFRPVFSDAENQWPLQNINMLENWPEAEESALDESQMEAMRNILTKRLSVVQGPPGTGKTYVSVQALKLLVQNMTANDPPIILTCQTNHALDQLLRHVSQFEPNFVRIGSGSKDLEVIKPRTLYELKQDAKPPHFKGQRDWRMLEEELDKLVAPLVKREAGPDSREVFDLELLRELKVLTDDQCNSVIEGAKEWISHENKSDDEPLLLWIGKQLEPAKQRHQPVLMGYEEVDDNQMGFEEIMEQEAEQMPVDKDDDHDRLGGTHWMIGDTWTGRGADNKATREHVREILKTKQDLWKIKASDRGPVYRHIQRIAKEKITERLRNLYPRYESFCEERKIHRYEFEESILRKHKIIGLTTTGVSKYRGLIDSLKPKIILIEEAAETLEAPVIAACMQSVEHLILIGDHKQLRPHCHVLELERAPYLMNISLFERLVNNDIEYRVLQRQRRMKPEIRRLLRPIYGTKIKDHASVNKLAVRPPVPGMGGLSTWFLTHEELDDRDVESSSLNRFEAHMIVGLVQYLRYNDVQAESITILTFYNGQRRLLRRLLLDEQKARGINLVTVDSYQGEENDVVILSTVRSNTDGKIGFLAVDNRVCVALSRAQRGFYIFGNGQLLASESWLWSQVITMMYNGTIGIPTKHEEKPIGSGIAPQVSDRRIGYKLPLWCSRHQRRFWIRTIVDWERNVGGCDLPCQGRLLCGHRCTERCHPWSHEYYRCTERCQKILSCGHPCVRECFDMPCDCAKKCGGLYEEGAVMPETINSKDASPNARRDSPPVSNEAEVVITTANENAAYLVVGGKQLSVAYKEKGIVNGVESHTWTTKAEELPKGVSLLD